MLAVELGPLVRRGRRDHGWHLRRLADQLGVEPSNVSKGETAEWYPATDLLEQLAEMLEWEGDFLGRFAAHPRATAKAGKVRRIAQ